MSPPLGVFCKHQPSGGSPLASGSFPWRKNGKNADALRDGIGLGMLSEGHPIKRDDLLKDIPDNNAFFSCADDRAKSHLKWAEALRTRVVFGIRELLRRFGYFWAPSSVWLHLGSKSNEENFAAKDFTPSRYSPTSIFHK
ncbi:hypothetical protein [Sphingobacterium mizutaii]|uniref:hypothetical protein n=1 Tax=Sphingobacterium mizutaii TaxID=1010 RepID=UPI0028A69C0C|nr:hypothetical protein [Sphingobacterium mizutaii]